MTTDAEEANVAENAEIVTGSDGGVLEYQSKGRKLKSHCSRFRTSITRPYLA